MSETIIDMKSRLYFTHKGTEKLFEGRLPAAGVELADRVSGDTTVGHALASCQALEAAAGTAVPDRARYLRVVLLEMERPYRHVADSGMIANDTGYAVAHSHCIRIRKRLLRLNKRLTGNRLLRGGVVPGGVGRDARRPRSGWRGRGGARGLRGDRGAEPGEHARPGPPGRDGSTDDAHGA